MNYPKCTQCGDDIRHCKVTCQSRATNILQLVVVGLITVFIAIDQGIILDAPDVPTSMQYAGPTPRSK